MNHRNSRSRLDQIDDYNKAVNWIVHKGKTDSETTALLIKRGLSSEEIITLIQSINTKYSGMKKYAPRKIIRYINSLIDLGIIVSIIIALNAVFSEYLSDNGLLQWVLFFVIFFSYYITQEFLVGYTIGKLITNTRVVNANGEKPSFHQILTRSICRFIPNAWWNETIWHDKFSNTFVTRRKSLLNSKM